MFRPRPSLRVARALLSCALASSGGLAASEPPTAAPGSAVDGQAAAREAFREASRLAQASEWAAALERYRASLTHFPHATTLYNAGYCHENLGDFAAALRDTRAALGFEAELPDRRLSAELRSRALDALTQLETKVGKVELSIETGEVAIRVDGRALQLLVVEGQRMAFAADEPAGAHGTPVLGSLHLVLNPGTHVLELRAGARQDTHLLQVRAAETQKLTLATPFVPPVATALPPQPSSAPVTAPTAASPDRARPQSLRTWGFATLAAGAGAALVGAGAGWMAIRTKQQLDARCSTDGACPSAQSERIRRFDTANTVSTAAFAGAVALSAIGGTLLLLTPSAPSHPRAELRISSKLELHAEF